jgi:hypothetical protein
MTAQIILSRSPDVRHYPLLVDTCSQPPCERRVWQLHPATSAV